jgi:hypothetical protein
MTSLLALDAGDRTVGRFHVGLSVQCHPHRKTARCIVSKDLNAGNGLASGPLSNGLQALLSESPIVDSDRFPIRHDDNIGRVDSLAHRAISQDDGF